jgi:hypothetical protein
LKLVAPYCTIKNVGGSNADAKGQQPKWLGWLADDVPPNIYDKRIVVHIRTTRLGYTKLRICWQLMGKGVFHIFTLNKIKYLGFSTSALIRPHKKAVKKIEAEGAKEKLLLLKLGNVIGL